MTQCPEILDNPSNPLFKLNESETYLFKEAKELLENEHYLYSIYAIYNCVIVNLQRRLEHFGIENLFNVMDKKENYNKTGSNQKDRWLNVNEYKTIGYARKLNIINHFTNDIITALYWMKSNTKEEENKSITQQEVCALAYLLEKNLFSKEFKLDMRNNTTQASSTQRRRKNDMQNDMELLNQTHQELLFKKGLNSFQKELKKDEKKNPYLLDKYI